MSIFQGYKIEHSFFTYPFQHGSYTIFTICPNATTMFFVVDNWLDHSDQKQSPIQRWNKTNESWSLHDPGSNKDGENDRGEEKATILPVQLAVKVRIMKGASFEVSSIGHKNTQTCVPLGLMSYPQHVRVPKFWYLTGVLQVRLI